MNRRWNIVVLLTAAVAISPLNLGASGRSLPSSSPSMREMTPEEMAESAYNSGIRHKDNGLKTEAKNPQKARSEYEKALTDFQRAAQLVPNMFQAYNGMGFAYRKTGDYQKALEMYGTALQMAPGFPDAIEYRGEAYLALNRIEDAKQAYLELFASDRKQADILMKSMSDWLTARKANPAGVDPATLTAFEGWIKERAALAGQTVSMGLTPVHTAWQ